MENTTRRERPRRRSGLSRHYAALLDRQAQSGLSLADFAASVGVAAGTLYRWRRWLAEGSETQATGSRVVEVSVMPLPPTPPASIADPPSITVDLRSGYRLDVRPGFDGGELRRLIGVLESC